MENENLAYENSKTTNTVGLEISSKYAKRGRNKVETITDTMGIGRGLSFNKKKQ